jgi:hypothetical protein
VIGLLSKMVVNHSYFLFDILEKCSECKTTPFTMEHRALRGKYCDKCCAQTIIEYQKLDEKNLPNDQKSVKDILAWNDIEHSKKIRELLDLIETTKLIVTNVDDEEDIKKYSS